MTVEEFKVEAAKLPAEDRFALAGWIEESEDVRALQRTALIRDLAHGLAQAERGELLEAETLFERLRETAQA